MKPVAPVTAASGDAIHRCSYGVNPVGAGIGPGPPRILAPATISPPSPAHAQHRLHPHQSEAGGRRPGRAPCADPQQRRPERFDVRIIDTSDFPAFERYEGRSYLREGKQAVWRNDDLQSFTPLRFAVPELMGYAGRAVLTDPDIFALADINLLLERDMGGAAILARQMPADSRRPLHYASSVMLLDCARLGHWHWEQDFDKTFRGERDYRDWMWLLLEPPGSVAPLEPEWNDFDRLTPETRLLHNTHRRTQPWKTGLPSDFTPRGTTLQLARRHLAAAPARQGRGPLPAPSRPGPGAAVLHACSASAWTTARCRRRCSRPRSRAATSAPTRTTASPRRNARRPDARRGSPRRSPTARAKRLRAGRSPR